jgi:cytochrome c553
MGSDSNLGNTPPGGSTLSAQLSCTGCHNGGGHHANVGNDGSTWLDGTDTGHSFRFLSGVQGVEDDDFGVNTANGANVYYGVARTVTTNPASSTPGTISNLCAKCHGLFHTSIYNTSTGEWNRHPTDVALPSGYQTNYGSSYIPDVPLATSDTTLTDFDQTQFSAASGVVICLSCHQAHGNANHDMLRFSYSLNQAGDSTQATGCETCHGVK